METTGKTQQINPYEVHMENMQRLQVIANTGNLSRSAPNSPMMRRGNSGEKLEKKNILLSPFPQRKNLQITEENRSRSLTHLAGDDGNRSRSLSPIPKNLSPRESPVGSPLSVSERIIKTHFLSNTTGTPGSYLLKKSDVIIKNKVKSPVGSQQMLASPSLGRKNASPNISRKLQPSINIEDVNKLTIHPTPPAAIVISPATDEVVVGFEAPDALVNNSITGKSKPISAETQSKENKVSGNYKEPSGIKSKQDKFVQKNSKNQTLNSQTGSDVNAAQILDIRESIGLALSKPKPIEEPIPTTNKQKIKKDEDVVKKGKEAKSKVRKAKPKIKLHHYTKYGHTHKSPGLLSPPTAPRGSKDLSAEMEHLFRNKEGRRLFEDLDHVEEVSAGTSSEDHEENLSIKDDAEEADGESKKSTTVFAMPPVFNSIPTQLQAIDYSIPGSFTDEIGEEEWENIKKCRYLRIGEKEGSGSDEESGEEYSFSDDDDDDEEEPKTD